MVAPLDEAALLRPVGEQHGAGARDAERLAERGLADAGIGADDDQRGQARRRDVGAARGLAEGADHGELRTAQAKAEQVVEHVVLQAGHTLHGPGNCNPVLQNQPRLLRSTFCTRWWAIWAGVRLPGRYQMRVQLTAPSSVRRSRLRSTSAGSGR